MKAKKSLGQNFLVHKETIERLINFVTHEAKAINTQDIIEIGPGHGVLTFPLLKKGYNITAIEKDSELVPLLKAKEVFYEHSFRVFNQDILTWSPKACKNRSFCIGNIPYNITSLIFMWLCKQRVFFQKALFMVQKEVADRITAPVGTKSYGRLSVKLRLLFDITKVFDVSAQCFKPVPKVDSAVVLLVYKERLISTDEEVLLETVTAFFFHFRRKMLRKTITEFSKSYKVYPHESLLGFFQNQKIPLTKRSECLSPEDYLNFVRYLRKITNS